MSGLKVLFVDDDERQLRAYRSLFQAKSFDSISQLEALLSGATLESDDLIDPSSVDFFQSVEFVEANQGHIAVDLVAQAVQNEAPFALAFIDMRMPPGMNGLQTALQIRELDPNIYLVFVTAYSDVDVSEISQRIQERLLYVQKPFRQEELKQIARNFIRSWQKDREFEQLNRAMQQMLLKHITNGLVYDITNPMLRYLSDLVNAEQGLIKLLEAPLSTSFASKSKAPTSLTEDSIEDSAEDFNRLFGLLTEELSAQSNIIHLLRTLFSHQTDKSVCHLSHLVLEIQQLMPELTCLPQTLQFRQNYLSSPDASYVFHKRPLVVLVIHLLRCLLKKAARFQAKTGRLSSTVIIEFSIGVSINEDYIILCFGTLTESKAVDFDVSGCLTADLQTFIEAMQGRYQLQTTDFGLEIKLPLMV